MKKYFPLILMSGVLLAANLKARAQVFAKPSGSQAIPLRVQNLRADVEIIGAVAVTNWTMDVSMESIGFGGWGGKGAVCDFVCARPRDAKVTAFSVGEGERALTGRVEEHAAVAPRVAFRAAKTDPLLRSGLDEDNSFRATIYPWEGIRIHMTWVQSLASMRAGATYRLPLLALRGATTRLAELDAKITVRDGAPQLISNSYHLPPKTQNGARVFSLGQKNYRVVRDLTLTFKPGTPRSIATLVSPDGSTGTGHFAFAFVAPRALKNFAVSGQGIEDTLFATKSVRAGEIVQGSGLYHGDLKSSNARFSANGLGAISLVPVQNEAASALWATQKINALSVSPTSGRRIILTSSRRSQNARVASNRAQIIALSKEYSVVSPFTSWLAVGDQNLKIYRHALVSSQLDPLVREYWVRIGDGQEKGARVAQLKRAVVQISRGNGLNVEDELYMRLGGAYGYVLAQKYSDYLINGPIPKPKPAVVEKRLARLGAKMLSYVTARTGTKATRSIDWGSPLYAGELYTLRTKIMGEYHKPHPDYEQLSAWEHRFAQLYGSTNRDPRADLWVAQVKAHEIEAQTTAAEKANDKIKLAQLQEERNANSLNAYFVNNIGDPPIYVSAPANAREVVAVMPDGHIKTLDYNRWEKRWEGNYDVPVETRDGNYAIQILIVNGDGSRRRYAMPFRVDTKAPIGKGSIELAPDSLPTGEREVRLQVEHGGDVAFVTALLPWGEKLNLLPSTVQGGTFFGLARVPRDYESKTIKVTFILTDRAHNATSIEAESVGKL